MLARKNSSHYIRQKTYVELENFSFTFYDAKDYATLEKWQKTFISFLIIETKVNVIVAQW
jgi:hypothetical protein